MAAFGFLAIGIVAFLFTHIASGKCQSCGTVDSRKM